MQKKSFLRKLHRPTWAEIDLSAIEHNFLKIKRAIGKNVKTLIVLKADAYGHGAVSLAKRLIKCGVDFFGLASIEEARLLRASKISKPILLLGVLGKGSFPELLKYRITPTITDIEVACQLNKYLRGAKKKLPVHIKIDTGMGRLGIWHKDFLRFIKTLDKLDNLFIEGIYTHLSSAETDRNFTNRQISLFKKSVKTLELQNIRPTYKHVANSAAVISFNNSYFNLVRPGLMIYGLFSDKYSERSFSLKPVMSFKTRIIYLKEFQKGCSISYGRTFVAKKRMTVAVLPVGYADGYNRLLSNRAHVLIRGKYCPVVGRVCMDHTMVDVSKVKAKLGDEVVIFGRQKNAEISVEEIASLCSTISYEITCWISHRVPRLYFH